MNQFDIWANKSLSSGIVNVLQGSYDAGIASAEQDPNHELKPEKFMEYYFANVATNQEYSELLNQSIDNALSRFAIK